MHSVIAKMSPFVACCSAVIYSYCLQQLIPHCLLPTSQTSLSTTWNKRLFLNVCCNGQNLTVCCDSKHHGLWSLSKPQCLLLSAFLKTSIMCTVFFLITTILKTLLPLSRHYSMLSLVNHFPQTTAAVKTLLCAATMRTLLFIASNPKARLTNKQRRERRFISTVQKTNTAGKNRKYNNENIFWGIRFRLLDISGNHTCMHVLKRGEKRFII